MTDDERATVTVTGGAQQLTAQLSDELHVTEEKTSTSGRPARWYAEECRKLGAAAKVTFALLPINKVS